MGFLPYPHSFAILIQAIVPVPPIPHADHISGHLLFSLPELRLTGSGHPGNQSSSVKCQEQIMKPLVLVYAGCFNTSTTDGMA